MQDSGPFTVSRPGTSVRTSLFVSYLLTLLLSFLVFAGSYQVTSRQARHTVSVVGRHLASVVDTYLDEARSESFALILNDYSQKLINYTSPSELLSSCAELSALPSSGCKLLLSPLVELLSLPPQAARHVTSRAAVSRSARQRFRFCSFFRTSVSLFCFSCLTRRLYLIFSVNGLIMRPNFFQA